MVFKSIRSRLIYWFLVVALVPLLLLCVLLYFRETTILKQREVEKLTAIRDLKAREVNIWLDTRLADLAVISQNAEIREFAGTCETDISDGETVQGLKEMTGSHLKRYVDHYTSFYAFSIINAGTGMVEVSTSSQFEQVNHREESHFTEPLKSGRVCIRDIYFSKLSGQPEMIFTIPIRCSQHDGKHVGGILMAHINLEISLYDLLLDRTGLGKTGETLIVNKDVVALNELRWYENAPLKLKIHAEPAVEAARGNTGITETEDYRQETVLAAYTHIGRTGWGFVAKRDLKEVYQPVRRNFLDMLLMFAVSSIIVIVIAVYLARNITSPVVSMGALAREIQQGNLSVRNEVDTEDELGYLANAFNMMLDTLEQLVCRIRDAGLQIVSSSAQILTASQQHAAAATEQSGQIAEISSAIDELTASARQVSQAASEVSTVSSSAVKNAEDSSQSVIDTISSMSNIKDSVTEMAKRTEVLKKKSRKITGILDLLDDITEQTNLLALNAAIESAKAGEAGKGFAVVADEIRKLADSSRKATKNIGELIEEIQNDTQDTVTDVEKNIRLVEQGSGLAGRAGESIKDIIASIEESAASVKQIAFSAQQQTSGTEQVSDSMVEINVSLKETMAGTEQSMQAARELAAMAEQLKSGIAMFKVRGQE